MNIDIKPLYNNLIDKISIKETFSYDNTYLENSIIRKLDNVLIEGNISKDLAKEIIVYLKIKGEMILPNSINLEDVIYSFDFVINENILEFVKKDEFSIDIFDIVWQNILLEVPMKVVSQDTDNNLSGNGWQLLTEDEVDQREDSRIDKLKDLLKERS